MTVGRKSFDNFSICSLEGLEFIADEMADVLVDCACRDETCCKSTTVERPNVDRRPNLRRSTFTKSDNRRRFSSNKNTIHYQS